MGVLPEGAQDNVITAGLVTALAVLPSWDHPGGPSETVLPTVLWNVPQRNAGPRPSAQMCLKGISGTR